MSIRMIQLTTKSTQYVYIKIHSILQTEFHGKSNKKKIEKKITKFN